MRQQRVMMDQFDRSALLQYHQQAITHALAPQQSQKQMPCQLVFPDDSMCIGSPALARGALFPTESDASQETEEERRRRLQNEPIVVYTSLSEWEVRMPEIAKRGLAWVLLAAVQAVCVIVILTGTEAGPLFVPGSRVPDNMQVLLYCIQLFLQPMFLIAMHLSSRDSDCGVDLLKIYTVLCQLQLVLAVALAVKGWLDVVVCALSVPMVLLANAIRNLMMPHCFMIRS